MEKNDVFRVMISRISDFLRADGIERLKDGLGLEVGGSGGILSGILSKILRRVICTDLVDHQLQYNGEFGKLLKEKFERNNQSLDLGKIEFAVGDAQNLIYRESLFDFVFSQNAFEHIPDPLSALREALRVLKPGGVMYITFDPVWTADSGSHFFDYGKEPWSHLLLSDEEFCKRMRAFGAQEWECDVYRTAMNRFPAWYYREYLPKLLDSSNVNDYEFEEWTGCTDSSFVNHANRVKAAEKLNCDPRDLLVRGFCFVVVK